MKAVHFGAGNIGRGFISEVYFDNNFHITLIDVNTSVIDKIKLEKQIRLKFASEDLEDKMITNVQGINSKLNPRLAVESFLNADIISASVGANNLKYIAETIAEGLRYRMLNDVKEKIDVIACENMINASQHLKALVIDYSDEMLYDYIVSYVGFPNAAIDRIVPEFFSDNILDVKVEPFREWIIENKDKKSNFELSGVIYVSNIEPYIERKLFSVNTGHATLAYTGLFYGYKQTISATRDQKVIENVEKVLENTSEYLLNTYGFDEAEHKKYVATVIERFSNPFINDDLKRIARNPITKLGYNERFIKPLRSLYEKGLSYDGLLKTIQYVFSYVNENDPEYIQLKTMLESRNLKEVLKEITQLDDTLVSIIVDSLK